MTTNEFKGQIERIFAAAIERDGAAREAYLEQACAGDTGLRLAVDALLAAAEASEGYFEALPGRLGIDRIRSGGDDFRPQAGQQFGHYRLTEAVGAGGMGAVWRAERSDGRFEGQVAVKLLTRTGSGRALLQFDREAHYLAKLTHPNIARLIDAGVGPDDVPYLILEFVEGVAIDRYCDGHELDIAERLRLFIPVLDAVTHAHARLVIHSDIKPSNVLVTGDGTVKLLDFGIATLISDEGSDASVTALTPEFAAPEQLTGEGVTTATDVYALGLLLYVLLAGANPRRVSEPTNLATFRALALSEPPSLTATDGPSPERLKVLAGARSVSPARLLKTLRGELDDVVRKALAVRPQDRYLTVADFASDLRRYLRREPVSAVPDSLNYRARKFVERHRGGVLGATLTFLLLLAAAIVTTWQSVEAERQRDIAIREQERVLATNEFLNMLIGELGPGGEKLSLQELLDRGVEVIDQQYGDNERTTGMTLYEMSILYGRLGQLDTQIALLDRSEAIGQNVDEDGLVANALCAKARLKLERDAAASAADLAAGIAVRDRMPRARRNSIIECYRAEALAQSAAGDHDGAIDVYRAGITVLDEAPVASPGMRLTLLNDLAEQYFMTDRTGEALGILDEIVDYHERLGRGRTVNHVIFLFNRSAVLLRLGEVQSAAEGQRKALDRVAGMDKAPIAAGGHYANSLLRLARYDEALEYLHKDYAAAEASGNDRWQGQVAMLIGSALLRMQRLGEAEHYLDVAERVFNDSPGAFPRQIVAVKLSRAGIQLARHDIDGATRTVNQVLSDLGYPEDKQAIGLSSALWTAANVALEAGDAEAALQYASDGVEILSRVARDPDRSADVGQALHQRAKARLALGQHAAGINDLRRAVTSLANGFGAGHPEAAEARERLSELTN